MKTNLIVSQYNNSVLQFNQSTEQSPTALPMRLIGSIIGLLLALILLPQIVLAQDKSGVRPQVISLPSGPGSLEGLGESFEPDLSTGTSSYPVRFTAPPGRIGFQPEISLNYNGGNANGPWGIGWKLSVPSIQRRTDDGIPTYDDEDTFIYSNGEKLVQLNNGEYRFENEGSFMRFRRLPEGGWEAHSPDGTHYLFGETENARVTNPQGIFRWELERVVDTHQNEMRYIYLYDGGYAYPREIRYNFGSNPTGNLLYNAVRFNYEPRPDIFTDRRSGAPIRIGLRGTNIAMWSLGKLVRAYAFEYEPERSTGTYSLLTSVTQVGDDGESTLPPHTFTYTQFDPSAYEVVTMENSPPVRLIHPDVDLIDINADGLPDMLYTPSSSSHRFYLNQGHGRWAAEPVVPDKSPIERLSSPNVRMADVNGDGRVDLLVKAGGGGNARLYYYRNNSETSWEIEDRINFGPAPFFDLKNPNVQLMDVNNDHSIDIVLTVNNRMKIWLARNGAWSQRADFNVPAPTAGVSASFENPRFKIGDMTGDRINDLVMVRNGQVVLWEHNGNGFYEEPTTILNPPTEIGNRDVRIQMGDLNNDGQMDLVLPSNRIVLYWLSLGNGSLTDPITLRDTPPLNATNTAVRLADIDGDGATELVYSRPEGVQYVDFSTKEQPFLLRSVDNGLGRTIHITYKSSIEDYIADQDAGNPWEITLPFPVQVVNRVTVHDANSGDDYIIDYHYRDGYYDGEQKEFRGFIRSQEIKVGDETAATTITNMVYDVGMEDEAHKGLLLESEILGEGGSCSGTYIGCYQRVVHQLETRVVVDTDETSTGKPIAYAFVKQTDSFIHEQQAEAVQLRQNYQQDAYGNQTAHLNYGQVCDGDVTCGDDELLTFTEFIYADEDWIMNRPQRVYQTDENGEFVSDLRMYYDGDPYVGLPFGQLTRGDLTRQEQNLGPNGDNRFVNTFRQAYDTYGNAVGIMDGQGNLATVEFDTQMHTFPIAEHVHLDDNQTLSYAASYHYGFGQVMSATEYNGHAHHFTYDTFGRITKMVFPGDTLTHPTKEFRYEIGSPRSAITTILREKQNTDNIHVSVDYYDGLGRKLQTRTEAEDNRVIVEQAHTFNLRQGNQHQFLSYFDSSLDYAPPSPTLPHIAYHYDPLVRVIKTVNPDGTFTSVLHKPLIQSLFDEIDNTPDSPYANTPLILKYDGLERLTSVQETDVIDGQNEKYQTTYLHDLLGNLTQVVDAQGNTKTMMYDALSRKIYMNDPNRGETSYIFDDANNLIQTIDAKGQVTHQKYDQANRLISEEWEDTDGTRTTVFTYHYDGNLSPRHPNAQNTLGRMTYVEYQGGADYFSFDPRGNIVGRVRHYTEEELTFVTQLTYDSMERLTTITFPNGYTIDYGYNEQGLLNHIPDYINNITYQAFGQRNTVTYTNHVMTQYKYDVNQRVNGLQTRHEDGLILQDLAYTHDPIGNIIRMVDGRPNRIPENDQNQYFQYDSLHRLIQATGTFGTINYGYDSIGNLVHKRTDIVDPRLNLGDLRYGENGAGPHAPTTVGPNRYSYDANGNLTQRGTTTMMWDVRNRMVEATVDTIQTSYLYGSGNARVRQLTTNGESITTTYYIDDYAELRDGKFIFYIFDDKRRVAQVTTPFDQTKLLASFDDPPDLLNPIVSSPHWYMADHLGGTSLID